MKSFLIILLLVTQGCAGICTGGWTKTDTLIELGNQGIIAADWMQTQKIVKNPDLYREVLLPREHPSMSYVNLVFLLWLPLHAGVSCALPPDLRHIWQGTTGVIEGVGVINNHRVQGGH